MCFNISVPAFVLFKRHRSVTTMNFGFTRFLWIINWSYLHLILSIISSVHTYIFILKISSQFTLPSRHSLAITSDYIYIISLWIFLFRDLSFFCANFQSISLKKLYNLVANTFTLIIFSTSTLAMSSKLTRI